MNDGFVKLPETKLRAIGVPASMMNEVRSRLRAISQALPKDAWRRAIPSDAELDSGEYDLYGEPSFEVREDHYEDVAAQLREWVTDRVELQAAQAKARELSAMRTVLREAAPPVAPRTATPLKYAKRPSRNRNGVTYVPRRDL